MVARFYVGPGNTYADPEGYIPWTTSTDRLQLCVYEPENNSLAPRAYASHDFFVGSVGAGRGVAGGHFLVSCPNYEGGEVMPEGTEWTYFLLPQNQTWNVDQWGLPGCTPIPE